MIDRTLIASMAVLGMILAGPQAWAQRIPTVNPGPEAAQITGSPGRANLDVFPVKFAAVNGRNISPRDVMWLEPGTYTLTVLIRADFTRAPALRFRSLRSRADQHTTIELELEAGKNYHIRARYNRDNRENPYSVILYRVDE